MQEVNREHFQKNDVGFVAPEFLLWACTGAGINSVRRCYEVLETYGDTILKLAATALAYGMKREDPSAGEGEVEAAKVIFVTNFHVFRVGYHNMRMHRFMRIMRDPEAKEWSLPLQGVRTRPNACPGKAMADAVESLIGAHFLTNDNLFNTLQWISDIKLVPLEQANILHKFKDAQSSTYEFLKWIKLKNVPFDMNDSLKQILTKYFAIPEVVEGHSADDIERTKARLFGLIERKDGLGMFGQHINAISHLHGQMFACQALKRLQKLQTEVLGYKFKEPLRLLEALTHRTGKSHYLLPFNYEKLEILGDAILDYLANSNLLRFTLFERYLECDPGYAQNKDYKFGEDFNPGDAHQAKM